MSASDQARIRLASRAGAFIDRDGVLNALVPDPSSGQPESPLRPEDVLLLPGAARAVKRLAEAGWSLVGVSNQPAAAKGTITVAEVLAIQERVLALLAAEGAHFDDFRLCLHHPAGVVPALTGGCDCRKPSPGMLVDGARALGIDLARSWMVGDADADMGAGQAVGCSTMLICHPGSAHKRRGAVSPDATAPDLASAVNHIVERNG